MKVVRIDWIDSCASNLNWMFPEDFKGNVEPITITTYGIVFQETDKVITVAQNYGYNPEQVCSLMTIPKGCIQSIKEIDHIEDQVKESVISQHDNKTCKENDDSLTSEDEKIRKMLIEFFGKGAERNSSTNGISDKDILAWLEKQKPIDENEFAKGILIRIAMSIMQWLDANLAEGNMCLSNMECEDLENAVRNADWKKVYGYMKKKLEKQGVQKPTIEMITPEKSLGIDSDTYNEIVDECIYGEQKPAWSEEDERNLQNIDSVLFCEISLSEEECMRLRDWLQSIKERAVWKPSEEQIQALNEAVGIVGLFTPRGSYLKLLSEQLKRL